MFLMCVLFAIIIVHFFIGFGNNALSSLTRRVSNPVLILYFALVTFMPFIEQYLAEFSRSFSFDILKLPLLILSVILLCSYIYLYFKTKHWPMLLASLLPLYLCYVSIDHYVFYRDKQWIISYAPEINSAVDCKGLVAMRMENGTANYRCMKAIFIGSKLGTPMIGWPDYRSGESVDFYNRVTAEMAKAEDPKL